MVDKEVKGITLKTVLSWIFGVLFTLAGILVIIIDFWIGLIFILVSIVLLPPINTFIAKRFKFSMSGGLKGILVIVLLIIGISLITRGEIEEVGIDNNAIFNMSEIKGEKDSIEEEVEKVEETAKHNSKNSPNSQQDQKEEENAGIEPQPEQASEPFIPELYASDIYLNLEDIGFECEGEYWKDYDDNIKGVYYCTDSTSDYDYDVEIFFGSSAKVLLIEATGINYTSKSNTENLSDFLGYIATIPYENASPEEARSWVESNIEKHGVEKVFGEVKYTIYGEAKTKILTLSHIDSTLD